MVMLRWIVVIRGLSKGSSSTVLKMTLEGQAQGSTTDPFTLAIHICITRVISAGLWVVLFNNTVQDEVPSSCITKHATHAPVRAGSLGSCSTLCSINFELQAGACVACFLILLSLSPRYECLHAPYAHGRWTASTACRVRVELVNNLAPAKLCQHVGLAKAMSSLPLLPRLLAMTVPIRT